MRLLDVKTFPPPPPADKLKHRPYAILSHVWEDDELTFSDLHEPEHAVSVPTAHKIKGAQRQAVEDGLDHIWIDTLCIDKTSSTELGEAINSMYRWYERFPDRVHLTQSLIVWRLDFRYAEADVCYVYLADLDGCPPLNDANLQHGGTTTSIQYWSALFYEARWFRRGWTLQELVAPTKLRFYDRDWNLIGDLEDLAHTVSRITGIQLSMLHHNCTPNDFSVAQRMCWAAGRETTRPEDRAYSLLGLLDMSIDIRYGEGDKAFIRLQEAIIERNADQSIFAWEKPFVKEEDVYLKEQRRDSYIWQDNDWTELLAPSPNVFAGAHNIVSSSQPSSPYRMTNIGLHITAQIERTGKEWILLNCYDQEDPTKAILLNLRCSRSVTQQERPVTVGHVWLRQRSPDEPLSPISRLSLMNVDQAVQLTKPKELFIATSRASSGRDDPVQNHRNVWLQATSVSPHCSLLFNASEPRMNGNTDSFTWTLGNDDGLPAPRPASLAVSMLYSMLPHSNPDEKSINFHLDLSDDHAFLQLSAPEMGREVKNTIKIFLNRPTALQQRLHLKLFPGISISASIHREHFHGQEWHIVKMTAQHIPIRLLPLKAFWRSLKGMNCGGEGASGNA